MSERINGQWRLASRPVGMVQETSFERADEPVPPLRDGEVLVQNVYLAFEPAMRGWMTDEPSYIPPVQIGEVMRASTAGQVIESRNPDFAVGDWVSGLLGWQQYVVTDGKPGLLGAATRIPDGVSPILALGALGITGLTAYFGMLDVGRPEKGDVVVVSGAAGATGSVAGQIGRIAGASRVVGIAGGAEKCAWLTDELGFDAAIDYKSQNVQAELARECPNGIDLFFDNVGGEILEAAIANMANHGTIVLCGGISAYNELDPPPGPRNYMQLVVRRCRMEGFIVIDFLGRMAEAMENLGKWVAAGELRHAEDIQEGFENTPKTFLRLFSGHNRGKQLLKIADPV